MDLKDKSLFIQKCFINGNWLYAESEETFDVINPSDQTKVGTMPNCSKKDTVKAIEAAKNGASCLRINPGNIGSNDRVIEVVKAAKDNNCSIRIGVNAGSLDKSILEKYK